MNAAYKSRSVRSPIQPKAHPAQQMREEALNTQDSEHPMRQEVRKLCQSFDLSVTFSEDTGTLETVKTPGLIAIRCVLSKDGRAVGIGHGSSVITRINKGIERSIFGCMNGSLMSAINSACKTLDAIRLGDADERYVSDKGAGMRNTYGARESYAPEPITDRQRQYLSQLASMNLAENDCEQFVASIDEMTKSEASEAIARWS